MSFQAYLDNIQAKTGKRPEDFIRMAREKRLLAPGVKAGQIVAWLKEDFDLGHGQAMAIVKLLKERRTLRRVRGGGHAQIHRDARGQGTFWH